MTRVEITLAYTVKDGRIISPGSFEGEPIYTPHFWDIAMDGMCDEKDGVTTIPIDANDRAQFPEIPHRRRVMRIYQDDQGFVYCF